MTNVQCVNCETWFESTHKTCPICTSREQAATDAAMLIQSLERADCTCPIKTARKGWKCNTCGKVVS